jgi:amino acid permease
MDSEPQKKSLLGRLLSLETLLLLIGLVFLGSGSYTGERIQLFWGIMISVGSLILYFVRKKDWKKHWEEQELMKQYLEERRKKEQDNDRNS